MPHVLRGAGGIYACGIVASYPVRVKGVSALLEEELILNLSKADISRTPALIQFSLSTLLDFSASNGSPLLFRKSRNSSTYSECLTRILNSLSIIIIGFIIFFPFDNIRNNVLSRRTLL